MTQASRPATRRRRSGAPIAVQIVLLMVAGLVAAQISTLALTLLLPFRSAAYSLEDVAAALKGGPLAKSDGRALVRSYQPTPPRDGGFDWSTPRLSLMVLSRLVEREESAIRLQFQWPPPLTGPPLRGAGPGPGSGPGPGGPPSSDAPPALRAAGEPTAAPPLSAFSPDRGPPPWLRRQIRGEFVAALQVAPQRWAVVRPEPEAFPNAWQRRLLLWFGAALAVIAPLGYLFARRLVSPLTAFAEAAERLGRDPRAPLLPLGGPAEIGRAARAFNDMQGRLKRYVEDRTGMIGAISHDLRTPLARLKFKVERVPEAERAPMLEDIRQMEAMITSVLTFIRDASEPGARERIDLRSLVECVVDDAHLVGGDVTLAPGDPVTVQVDPLAIQRVVANLVENAVKYGGGARVTLSAGDDEALVAVADRGPGLAPGDLERVFKPFYRSEAARTLDGGGVGLGLSISRAIARGHGGDVTLRNGALGLVAELCLPLPIGAEGRRDNRRLRESRQ